MLRHGDRLVDATLGGYSSSVKWSLLTHSLPIRGHPPRCQRLAGVTLGVLGRMKQQADHR